MSADQDYLLIAALDFGTTYSGCAFQMTSDYDPKNPTHKILSPQAWNEGPARLTSMKTPTCLLLDNNKEIDSFGYMAEDKYAELCMDGDDKNFYFFRRFKMELHDTKCLTSRYEIADEGGRKLPAMTVFSRSIECLKMHLHKLLSNKKIDVHDGDVKWVLTVPAIWDDTAKGFMRTAAEKAGIPSKHLCIALEPEAASLFCQYLPVEKFSSGGQVGFSDAKPGTTYMIVDLGGGTADITVHEKVSSGKLKEVHRASGGPWGGTAVDAAFLSLLSSIIGGPIMSAFMRDQKYDYLELMREFESVKRNVGLKTTDPVRIKIPVTLSETCVTVVQKDFKTLVKEARRDKQISFVGDKVKFDAGLMKELFKKTTDKVVGHMKTILEKQPCGKKVSLILMVGGFSESTYIQDVIKKGFHEKGGKRVLIPKEAGISVVQGAVVFGRQPGNITSRVLRYTYGAKLNQEFVKGHHDSKRLNVIAGVERCNGCFGSFVANGTEVTAGKKVCASYKTTDPESDNTEIEVFVTEKSDPMYTDDDGCRSLGSLRVEFPNPTKEIHEIDVEYVFGDTELHVNAIDRKTKTPCATKLKMFE